ncbi:unnamed protein product, partial [Prorocentrum cordatum]
DHDRAQASPINQPVKKGAVGPSMVKREEHIQAAERKAAKHSMPSNSSESEYSYSDSDSPEESEGPPAGASRATGSMGVIPELLGK